MVARTGMAVVLGLLAAAAWGQEQEGGEGKRKEPPLLGVVTAPCKGGGLELLHVLEGSPAARAGLERGDVLLEVGGNTVAQPLELSGVLVDAGPGTGLDLKGRRGKEGFTKQVTLAGRSDLEGDFLERRKVGETGFEAPPWYAYAWTNLPEGAPPPTLQSTKGKVVALHAFQAW